MKTNRVAIILIAMLSLATLTRAADEPRKLAFEGVLSEHRMTIKDLDLPSDWTGFTHLVMEMKPSTPQRFALWVYTQDGPKRVEIQPFGQNAWLRASIPLEYFNRKVMGADLAASNNRRTNSFWMSVWGPFGELKGIDAIGLAMQYPLNHPTIELRNVHLAKQDEGSEFLENGPVVDEFGQWAIGDCPRKIHSPQQLEKELADEEKAFGSAADFGYGKFGGYQSTQAKATGFFHVEQINGVWWFVDPEGHYFLSTSSNGIPGGAGGRGAPRGGGGRAGGAGRAGGRGNVTPPSTQTSQLIAQATSAERLVKRLDSWGLNTGGPNRPSITYFRAPAANPTFLGLGDVYSDAWVQQTEQAGEQQLAARKDDPMLIGYYIGNEPPWGGRESELVDLILAGPDSATKTKLKSFLAQGDTPQRRTQFVVDAFAHYLDVVCSTIRKNDPNHLILGIRFGGKPADEVVRLARVFDVISINVYDYEPTKQAERVNRLTGKPVMVGEFHIGVPENGLGAGLVQAANQTERGVAYRYYVEQAIALPYCLGAHWFQWTDEPVLGRMDGENYNIGFIDAAGRAHPELIDAAKATHKRLLDVHAGKTLPFNQRPKASEVGAPSTPWDALDVRIGSTNQ
jgi:hypothetical protein